MSIAPKSFIAASLLVGVTVVWIPRLTGFDPFGWMPEELPSSGALPTSGADPHAVVEGELLDAQGPPAEGDESRGALDEELPLRSLQDVVSFLERRDEPRKARDGWSAVDTGDEGRDYVSQIEVLPLPGASGPTGELDPGARGPSFSDELQLFLRENPLHTIIEGGGRTTATFGYLRVGTGESLLDGRAQVVAIDLEGVVLTTPAGPLRVHLPPPGQRTYSRRHELPAAGGEDSTDLEQE